jgi:glycosyltransferase involved in cell wall biosynthesis
LKPTVLHLAKWYPNKVEPLLGVFVRKHVLATKNDFNHTVISIYGTDAYEDEIVRIKSNYEGVEEVIYYYKKGIFTKMKVLYSVWKEMNSSSVALIHAHIISWSSTLAYLHSLIYKTPYFISEHWSGYHYKLFIKQNSFVKYFKRLSAKKAKMLFPVSQTLKRDMLASKIKASYKVIGNVVDGTVVDLPKNNKFTFIFVGDLEQKHKNVNGILKAFSELDNNLNIQLDIIGDGLDKQAYIAFNKTLNLSASVNFHGAKSNTAVFEYLAKSHVLVLNSNYETFSIICAEALLSGIPVIATRCGGPEAFLNEQTGKLIDVGNTGQLIEAMKEIQNKYDAFKPAYLKAKAKAYSLSTIGRELANNYKSVLS